MQQNSSLGRSQRQWWEPYISKLKGPGDSRISKANATAEAVPVSVTSREALTGSPSIACSGLSVCPGNFGTNGNSSRREAVRKRQQ